MSSAVQSIRQKLKRQFSHKDKDMNLDDADSADEETSGIVNKEYSAAENDDAHPEGRPGSLLNRMISYGNKKTDDEIARDKAEYDKRQAAGAGTVGAVPAGGVSSSAGAVPTAGAVPIADAGASGGHHGHHGDGGAGAVSGGDGGAGGAGASGGSGGGA